MTGLIALSEALARGGRVAWDRVPPRLLVPPALRPKVEADRATVREVLRRAAVFRAQAQAPGPVPFLYLPEAGGQDGGCLSCADALEDGRRFRCRLCELAVRIALDLSLLPEETVR